MLKNSGNMKNINSSKIIGIQFSILSPEEIRKGSVAEITSKEAYINNKPVINGLFDPRMGVLEPGLVCPTDGLDYMQTPGYFGHIELARPVFYIQYLSTIQKVLRCVCFKCSKLLVSKEKYKQALKMQNQHRWKYVFELCKGIKRCGEDTEDGCGCLQPKKIKKEGMSSLFAEWVNTSSEEDGDENIIIPLTPELVLKIFKRISDEDVTFMGFSPIWSRPDWMICQVLSVPPPAVRPSVKHDAQQRSEDDLTHILVNIVKSNKTLLEKIQNNAPENIINDWAVVLQYHIASMIDNKLPGASPAAQRSGRPFKSIKDRLNGKGGRMRGNLMAKRVDFSARSVITADPNISIRELGIPMKIAKNITKPVVVNRVNKSFLTKLVQNGPDIWPGAKILERKNGQNITLRYLDRKSIILEDGDIVHRHMMDGDAILFNRQPTLHRMSMMCHIAKIMKRGDTFRMNVADTKPYNADFDGDEMNLHMPQDPESESELKNLAAVPYQIISPSNNAAIIGIYQDSMLGCYRFTREQIDFTQKDAMNLLMLFNRINPKQLNKKRNERISNFEILSQIMPPLSLKVKNKQFDGDKEKSDTSNNVVEIIDGKYIRGQMDKGILGSGTKGLIHRVCNDFGNMASSQFIDDLQNIITEYMKQSAFSVGISDLITNSNTNDKIISIITEKKTDVKNLIDQVKIGVFENNSGKTNEEEFETKVNNILSKAQNEAGREALKSLSKDNRFVVMFNAGSKGSEINIQQMTACLGQQNVDGKRIPYGFEHRTLPHYTKYDDSAIARGFVESSYINGLSPQELFFHAMGGRVGLIDTAVKTSTTGYIQRRLIKGLEDLMVTYDMTIRTNKNKVVQFSYGDDSIDTVKVENQDLPIIDMSIQDIYSHFAVIDDKTKSKAISGMFVKSAYTRHKKQEQQLSEKCEFYINYIIQNRTEIVKNVFNNKSERVVRVPVAFAYIIQNIIGQQGINKNSLVDITMYEAYEMIEHAFNQLQLIVFAQPTELFKVLYFYYLSPKDLLLNKRFNKKALDILLQTIIVSYKRAIVAPGEMVGMIAAQSIGEPTTQMTLNTFHFAGVASKSNVTRGVPRIEEILSLSASIKNPSLTVYLNEDEQSDKDKANTIQYMLEHTKLAEIVTSVSICFDPDDLNTLIAEDKLTMSQYREFENLVDECMEQEVGEDENEKSKWIIRMEMDPEIMLEKNITMDDVNFTLNNTYKDEISCVYSDYNADKLVFRIRMNNILKNASGKGGKKIKINPLDQSDQIYILKNFQDQLLEGIVLRGVKNINKVILRKIKDNLVEKGGAFIKQDIWVLDTIGTNLLSVLGLDYIDSRRTISNDIVEIFNVLGIEAARQCIYNELSEVLEFDGSYVNAHHMALLCDRMTFTSKLISIFRHGINNDDIGPIAKASFEETPEMFLKAARHAELDTLRGISANVMCGQEGLFGTAAFQVVLDINEMINLDEKYKYEYQDKEEIISAGLFEGIENPADICSKQNLEIQNNVSNILVEEDGYDDNYNPFA
jgi:DNA-directed RNA polymerase II subunit RPB1